MTVAAPRACLIALVGAALAHPAGAAPEALRARVLAHVRDRQPELLHEYAAFLALPNVASDAEAIRRNAEHVVGMLAKRGIAARLLDGAGRTARRLRRAAGGRPEDRGPLRALRRPARRARALGEPAVDAGAARRAARPRARARSTSATLRGPLDGEWRIFARSASDDKAPDPGDRSGARRAAGDRRAPLRQPQAVLRRRGGGRLAAPRARSWRANRELLRADAWLLCDGPVHQSRRMQVVFGARGVTDVEITRLRPVAVGPQRPLRQLGAQPGGGARAPGRGPARPGRPDRDRRLLRRRARR